jgi:hypothetical protein
MSALGRKRTYAVQNIMSALPSIATAKAGSANGHVCFTPENRHVQCKGSCPPRDNSGPQIAIFRGRFSSAYSHPLAGAFLFPSGHNHIHIEGACIAQAASAAQRCQGIPFFLVPSLRRRRASRVKCGRSATVRADARFERPSTSGRCPLAFCA